MSKRKTHNICYMSKRTFYIYMLYDMHFYIYQVYIRIKYEYEISKIKKNIRVYIYIIYIQTLLHSIIFSHFRGTLFFLFVFFLIKTNFVIINI